MRVLELFSGTGSVNKVAKKKGWEVISVDITDKWGHKPTHQVDILKWDYKQYPVGHFDIIWASPPCASFSVILHIRNSKEKIKEKMEKEGLPLLYKTREIIDYFKPKYYFIENPATGRMKNYIKDLPSYKVSYCMYGFPYRKHTLIWTNRQGFTPKKCNHKGRHSMTISIGYEGKNRYKNLVSKKTDKYAIPQLLIEDLLNFKNKQN